MGKNIEVGTVDIEGGSVSWELFEDDAFSSSLTLVSRASFQYQSQIFLVSGCVSNETSGACSPMPNTTILTTTENVGLSSDVGSFKVGEVSKVSRSSIDKESMQSQQ